MHVNLDHIEFVAGGAAMKVGQFIWSIFAKRISRILEARIFGK